MLGEKIKNYLIEHGIKQRFLAEKLELPDPVISDMLNGQRKIDAVEYYQICKALRVSLEYFFVNELVEN